MAPILTLYSAGTPSGQRVSLFLEELKEAYPNLNLEYTVKALSFPKNEQKSPEYLKINPNGRIPAIVHHRPDGTDFTVFESAAIILYMIQRFDTEHKLSFATGSDDESEALQWIMFAHGGVAPMQGQAIHFFRFAPEKIQYGIKRYQDETKRLYSVLDSRLADREWLAGGKYSIADINVWPWVNIHDFAGVDDLTPYPNLSKWIDHIRSRPAAERALQIPPSNRPKAKEEEEKVIKEASAWIAAQGQGK